ncbi:hypothetical protein DFH06DRAFT_1344039 [Mycena polygramma]|nr:hypothetical protein DFH06DRAFT_1344039 [Mycena polygramma]
MILPPHLVKYLAKTFGAWYVVLEILGTSLDHIKDDKHTVREYVFDSLADMYAELTEDDMFYGVWRHRCLHLDTNIVLAFEQNGIWEQASNAYEIAQNKARTIPTPRRRVFEASIALLKLPATLDKNIEFTKILEDATMQLSLRKWVALPPQLSAAHVPLLQHFQQFVDLQEAVQIFGSLSTTTAQNLEEKSSDLKIAGLEVINNTNFVFFSVAQKTEFYTLKGIFHARFKRNEEANNAFSQAVQLDMTQAKAWAAWGRFNDNMFKKVPNDLSYAANAVSCYLQTTGQYKSGKSKPLIARIQWLLSVDNSTLTISHAFDTYKGDAAY